MTAKPRVLVAEDSPTQQIQIVAYLEDHGFEVDLAKNGVLALEKIRVQQPDLVVTDLEMPEMNGLELVTALQREFKKLPVILITARGSEKIAADALRAGAASYVPKQHLETHLAPTLTRTLDVLEASQASERLSQFLAREEADYVFASDTALVPHVIARFQETMSQFGLADENQLMQVSIALDEALVNAIIHGNLEVTSDLRSIDDGKPYYELITKRQEEAPYQTRQVYVSIAADREQCSFVIRDEGPGFNPHSIPDPTDPANLETIGGRGLMLITAFMDEVKHNESGNEIRMMKRKQACAV